MPPTLDPNTKVPVVPPRTYPGAKRGRKPRNDSTTPLPTALPVSGVANASTSGAATTTSGTSTPTTPALTPAPATPALAYRPPTTTTSVGGSTTPSYSYAYQTPPLKLAPPHIQIGSASSNTTATGTTPSTTATTANPGTTLTQPSTSAAASTTTTTTATATTATTAPAISAQQHPYYSTTPGTGTTSYAHYYTNPSVYSRQPVPVSVPTTAATTAPAWSTTTTSGSIPLALPNPSSGLSTSSYTPTTGYTYTPAAGTTPQTYMPRYSLSGSHSAHPVIALSPAATAAAAAAQSQILRAAGSTAGAVPIIANPAIAGTAGVGGTAAAATAMDEDEEGEEHELPFMSDDVYGQGLLWQSQSKENLKVLMDHFTPEQFERYEAYRRSAFQKQSVRKVIQQATPYTASQPVAQVVAGFAKVFVGEIIEKARKVQAKYNSQGTEPESEQPLSPEHIREAYRLYQFETGKIGAARVHKGRKLFVR